MNLRLLRLLDLRRFNFKHFKHLQKFFRHASFYFISQLYWVNIFGYFRFKFHCKIDNTSRLFKSFGKFLIIMVKILTQGEVENELKFLLKL